MNRIVLPTAIALLVLASITGCQPTENMTGDFPGEIKKPLSAAQATPHPRGDEQSFLKRVLDRYHSASSYHDRGQVRLTTTENSRKVERVAPMSMWLDRGELDLIAYDVRITVEKSILQAWFVSSGNDPFDSQVLRKRMPPGGGRPSLREALADPTLSARLAGGLAGPPPQLEWLFAAEPMKFLFLGDHVFDRLADQRIDGRVCHGIRVMAGADEYRFYVDSKSFLIRQVDLPRIIIPVAGGKQREVALSIELTDASFDPPQDRSLRDGFPDSPKWVDQFSPLPLSEPMKR